jgi:hypothetical protein
MNVNFDIIDGTYVIFYKCSYFIENDAESIRIGLSHFFTARLSKLNLKTYFSTNT